VLKNFWTDERTDLAIGIAYNVLLVLLSPLLAAYLVYRMAIQGKSRTGWRERLGFVPPLPGDRKHDEPLIWVHAVSVGEVAAAEPILRELRSLEPLAKIVLSVTTPTGREMAQKRNLDIDGLFYFPFDLPIAVARALDTLRPSLFIAMETELWPNFLWAAKRRGVKTMVANARVSDRSFRRSGPLRPLYRWMLKHVDWICVQSPLDAERFVALGADEREVQVVGNSKFDEAYPEVSDAEQCKLRQDLGFALDAPVVVAGSTNPGEEEIVLDAFWQVRVKHPDARLLIAPRHPERTPEIEEIAERLGYATARRTEMLKAARTVEPSPAEDSAQDCVVLLDTIGELARVYSIATVTFVGGSLVPKGGQNILQAIAQGKPVFFGPYMHNFRDSTAAALAQGVGFQVRDAKSLAQGMLELLDAPDRLEEIARKGREMIEASRGAARRCGMAAAALLSQPG